MGKRPSENNAADMFGKFLENLLLPEEIQRAIREDDSGRQEDGEIDPEELAWRRAAEEVRNNNSSRPHRAPKSLKDLKKKAPAAVPASAPRNAPAPAAAKKRMPRKPQAADKTPRSEKKNGGAPELAGKNRFIKFLRSKPGNVCDALILAEIIGKPVGLR